MPGLQDGDILARVGNSGIRIRALRPSSDPATADAVDAAHRAALRRHGVEAESPVLSDVCFVREGGSRLSIKKYRRRVRQGVASLPLSHERGSGHLRGGSEVYACDGDLKTLTTVGNTVDDPGQRIHITLGYSSKLNPG